MERFLGFSEYPYKKGGPVSVKDGHVKEPQEISMALGARPTEQLLLQSVSTSVPSHI